MIAYQKLWISFDISMYSTIKLMLIITLIKLVENKFISYTIYIKLYFVYNVILLKKSYLRIKFKIT